MNRRRFLKGGLLLLAGGALTIEASPITRGERKAILNALRSWVRQNLHLRVVFVVKHLKVENGWAWIETMPQSPDGREHYEAVSALLKKGNGCWAVVAVPSGECAAADDPERACREEMRQLIQRVVHAPLYVPQGIFSP